MSGATEPREDALLDAGIADRVASLRSAGQHREAAELALAHGAPRRASDLFAEAWDFAGAVRVARGALLLELAYRYALAGELRADAREILEALADHPDEAARASVHAERKGQLGDAARLLENAADIDGAAAMYERGGELYDAARCREAQGRYREAGVLYERRVRESPEDGEAALRLGRILAHFGRWDHAVRALQTAATDDDRRAPARRLMVACFAALGLDEAAASQLDQLRRDDPSLPITVPEFLSEQFGDERGIAGLTASAATGEERLLAGRYRVLCPLGAGATGRVLLAHDGFHDRDVAVKVLTVGGGAAGRDAYVRFAREARVAAGLDHPNVVRVYEFNPDGPFIVMEHMAGGTLEDRLDPAGERALAMPVIRHVLVSILAGLEAVHRRGVVHRDLKPANVFFGATGDVKIGDFGVAHLSDLGTTLTGAMLGTLAYMAPEQITGSTRPDAATDLYALGVIAFRMLSGVLPFPGPDFVTQHLQTTAPRLSDLRPELGPRFDALIDPLLEKDAANRPRVTAEVRAIVDALPWAEPSEDAFDVARGHTASAPRRRPSSAPPPPPPDSRWAVLDRFADGSSRARDSLLGRVVRVVPCDAARLARLLALAAADSPHLQAVYDVDETEGRAVLEEPLGRALLDPSLSPSARRAALADVRRAVAHAHSVGVAHGAIDEAHVRVGAGRGVLLLPEGAGDGATPTSDDAALEALVARLT